MTKASWDFGRIDLSRIFSDVHKAHNEILQDATLEPECDLEETASEVVIRMDIPGVAKEDLLIEAHGNVITVSGPRKTEKQAKSLIAERWHGRFKRSFKLADIIDVSKVTAKCKDGVLVLTIGKTGAEKPQQIKID